MPRTLHDLPTSPWPLETLQRGCQSLQGYIRLNTLCSEGLNDVLAQEFSICKSSIQPNTVAGLTTSMHRQTAGIPCTTDLRYRCADTKTPHAQLNRSASSWKHCCRVASMMEAMICNAWPSKGPSSRKATLLNQPLEDQEESWAPACHQAQQLQTNPQETLSSQTFQEHPHALIPAQATLAIELRRGGPQNITSR